jgi:hypothetical protein
MSYTYEVNNEKGFQVSLKFISKPLIDIGNPLTYNQKNDKFNEKWYNIFHIRVKHGHLLYARVKHGHFYVKKKSNKKINH